MLKDIFVKVEVIQTRPSLIFIGNTLYLTFQNIYSKHYFESTEGEVSY